MSEQKPTENVPMWKQERAFHAERAEEVAAAKRLEEEFQKGKRPDNRTFAERVNPGKPLPVEQFDPNAVHIKTKGSREVADTRTFTERIDPGKPLPAEQFDPNAVRVSDKGMSPMIREALEGYGSTQASRSRVDTRKLTPTDPSISSKETFEPKPPERPPVDISGMYDQ